MRQGAHWIYPNTSFFVDNGKSRILMKMQLNRSLICNKLLTVRYLLVDHDWKLEPVTKATFFSKFVKSDSEKSFHVMNRGEALTNGWPEFRHVVTFWPMRRGHCPPSSSDIGDFSESEMPIFEMAKVVKRGVMIHQLIEEARPSMMNYSCQKSVLKIWIIE